MQSVQAWLIEHAASLQTLLFALTVTSLWFLEKVVLTEPADQKWGHSATNAKFILSAMPIQLIFSVFLIWATGWVTSHQWGLVYILPHSSSPWIKYVLMFFLLDFLAYVYHVAAHNVPLLWRFHLVHHTDTRMDVSTDVREHPGETFFRNSFLVVWVFLSGACFGIIFLRQLAQTLVNISSHSKLRLPSPCARLLNMFLVTPNLHHVHHHFKKPYTNRNYGDVFCLWDRIFGTFAELPSKEVVFGLDTHMAKATSGKYLDLIFMPFRRPAQKPITTRAHESRHMPFEPTNMKLGNRQGSSSGETRKAWMGYGRHIHDLNT